MTFASPRALCVFAALAMPASLIAQASRSPTIFSPASQNGMVNVRVAVVQADYSVRPLPLLSIVARKADRSDSLGGKTDLEGRVALSLPAGSYVIRARSAPMDGRAFSWSIPVTVKGSSKQSIDLTNANASADSVVVAAAPAPAKQPAPAPAPVREPERQVASKPAVVEPTPTPTVNAPAQPSPFDLSHAAKPEPRPAAPAPVAVPVPAPARRVEQPHARSHTSGLFLGIGLNGSSIQSDDLSSDTESGGGLAGELGYGFTRHLAMFVNASAARISSTSGDFDLGHFDIGGRWNFASPSRAIAPFLDVAYGGRVAMESDVVLYDDAGQPHQGDLSIVGTGLSFGGGLNYFVSPSWALGGALKYTIGEFSRVQFDNVSVDGFEIDATSARFNLGFTWFPGGRR